jgi:hypothetical protein
MSKRLFSYFIGLDLGQSQDYTALCERGARLDREKVGVSGGHAPGHRSLLPQEVL